MAGAAGPNTAESGLVFAYDLGNTITSYIGEPTINEANTDYLRTIQFHNQGGYGNAGYILDAPERGPDWKKIIVTNRGNNFRIAQFPYIVQNYGTTKVYSVEYDFGITSGYFIYGDGSSGFGVLQDDGKRVTARFTPPSAGSWSEALFLGNYTPASGIYDIIYYRNYQVEINTHPTQFTPTSRSVTQGLLDLLNTSTINITNASFDSNAQLTFDGTNDYIEAPFETILNDCSFEVWFKATSTRTYQYPLAIRNNSVGSSYAFYLDMNDPDGSGFAQTMWVYWNSGGSPYSVVPKTGTYGDWNDSTWRHYVFTRSTTNSPYTLHYMNGNLVSTINRSGDQTTQFGNGAGYKLYLGQYGGGFGYFPGDIPIVKIYNRVLTPSEVQTNYNATKARFNL